MAPLPPVAAGIWNGWMATPTGKYLSGNLWLGERRRRVRRFG